MVFLFILGMLLAACSGAAATPSMEYQASMAESGAPAAPAMEEASFDQASSSQSTIERIVIKNADLEIVVANPADSMERISKMAEAMGGYVVTANLFQQRLDSGAEVPQATITIRVPAERLNEALEDIRSESDRLPRREDLNSQDVTSEYTDLQSRLRNLENAEAQLQEIMASANKTEDVLSVYNELVSVREQIEVIKGQIQYYEQSAALSAITTSLVADEAVKPLTIGGWEPGGVAKRAIQALINAVKYIVNAAIWVILFVLPVLLLIFAIFFLPVILLIWALRRRRKNRQQSSTPVEVAPPAPPAE
jgi:hypothetical protein